MQGKTNSKFYAYNTRFRRWVHQLRRSMTRAKARLWIKVLHGSRMKGHGFKRQRSVESFIADFVCKDLGLIIEVDSINSVRVKTIENETIKYEILKRAGFTVLSFTNKEVLKNIDGVRLAIESWINLKLLYKE